MCGYGTSLYLGSAERLLYMWNACQFKCKAQPKLYIHKHISTCMTAK